MTTRPTDPADHPESGTYEIRLRGHLDSRWTARLGVVGLTHESDGTTILTGISGDQAALHGLLLKVRDLGLTLVSVTRIGAEPDRSNSSN